MRAPAGTLLALLLMLGPPPTSPATTLAPTPPAHSPQWSSAYDSYFRKYAKRFFGPGFDWHWFKAQAIAESTLDPAARSPTGARGLMQILPSTFAEIKTANPHFSHLEEPRWNIAAGIYYDRVLYDRWDTPPPLENRLAFTFASYNAGYGGIRRAAKRAARAGRKPDRWTQVEPHAPAETRRYVRRIRQLMGG
jgi:soluble lytic murein transglycosylase-like protein